jgi:coniferyl-aldehyde dehydrogenase
MKFDAEALNRILAKQRESFRREGAVSLEVRKQRVSRMAIALLDNINEIAEALNADYGTRPAALTKAFEAVAWSQDILHMLGELESWMESTPVPGGFVQNKPKGVVGIVGAWNFPITLTFEPAMAALAAGNRVMLNYSEFHPRTGKLLADIMKNAFPEEEVAFIHGDLETAQAFGTLRFDHLFFTGSPKVGSIISAEAGRNLVPVTMELGGKNPVIVAPSADLALASRRVAATRMLNSGQICLCPDYVFVHRNQLDEFVDGVVGNWKQFYPSYLDNDAAVSIINDANYGRVCGLVEDAVAQGAKAVSVVPDSEQGQLPNKAARKIAPTLLLDVPESARIAREEVFGPVLSVYAYDDIAEVIEYVNSRPSPLAAYWYGQDDEIFRQFLDQTTSGGVTRNDALVHALLPGAPFGGIGNSGSGAYHGKAGFDTFTHRRTVAVADRDQGVADTFVSGEALTPEAVRQVDAAIATVKTEFSRYL